MKKIGGLVTLVLFLSSGLFSQIPEISITISHDDSLELYSRDVFSNDYLKASFSCGGEQWKKTELRFKGRSNRSWPKKSFRIKFPDDHLFHGAREINLNSMYLDRSFLREKLSWMMFEDLHALAPHAMYVRLMINKNLQGLYLLVDHVDKYFLPQHKKKNQVALYEADSKYALGDLTEEPEKLLKMYYSKHAGGDNFDDLQSLISTLNTTPDSLFEQTMNRIFDMQSVYNWFTGNILTMNGDSYSKNYYLYKDDSVTLGKWTVIPWDYDLTFGVSGDPAMPVETTLLNDGFGYTFPPLMGLRSVLKDRLWKTLSMREHLRRSVDVAMHYFFNDELMDRRIDSLIMMIQAEVERDPQKRGTMQDFFETKEALKFFVTARRQYLLKTFIHRPEGLFDDVTLSVKRGWNYFVGVDGRQIAKLWFPDVSGLDSVRVVAHPGKLPPQIGPDSNRCVRRWIQIETFPPSAKFQANFEWTYHDLSSKDREVQPGVTDEHALRCFWYDGTTWKPTVGSEINPVSNTVKVVLITEEFCNHGKYFAIKMP